MAELPDRFAGLGPSAASGVGSACSTSVDGGCSCSADFDFQAWWRVGIAAVIAANAMSISLAINSSEATAGERIAVHGVLCILALISMALLAWPMLRAAIDGLLRGRVTLEALFLTGIFGAFGASVFSVIRGTGPVYFEVVCLLLLAYAFGRQLAARVRDKAFEDTLAWMDGISRCRRRGDDGILREVPVAEIRPGDLIQVAPGEMFPVDGKIDAGVALVREAELTGEHFAVAKRPGDQVFAGTHLLDAAVDVRAISEGEDRRIDAILRAVDGARLRPSSIETIADQIVQRFLPVVLLLSLCCFGAWTFFSSWESGLMNAMSVLLVACPCALGLATPLAMRALAGRLARRGLIVKSFEALESLAEVDTVVFDKTGTLTGRESEVVDLLCVPGMDLQETRGLLALVELQSRHPIAAAFSGEKPSENFELIDSRVLPGLGIAATVRPLNSETPREIVVGAAEALRERCLNPVAFDVLSAELHPAPGSRQIAALSDGKLLAVAALSERLHQGWPKALQELRLMGLEVLLMTGDLKARADAVESDRVMAEMKPEEKAEEVRRLKAGGQVVLFAGDGVNDAEALAAADVAISVSGGAEIAEEVGEISWFGGDVRDIPWAIDLAREAGRVVRSNLRFTLVYNSVGILLALAGLLHPVAASLLMISSSLIVSWRAASLIDSDNGDPAVAPTASASPALEGVSL